MLKKYLPVLAAILAIYVAYVEIQPEATPTIAGDYSETAEFRLDRESSGTQVRGQGVVSRVLADDNDGSRHQRFILRLASGQTLLVAHNIDLAPRLPALKNGDTVRFYGEYEWNDRGGVVHWTHHDPRGQHAGGWLELNGRRYE